MSWYDSVWELCNLKSRKWRSVQYYVKDMLGIAWWCLWSRRHLTTHRFGLYLLKYRPYWWGQCDIVAEEHDGSMNQPLLFCWRFLMFTKLETMDHIDWDNGTLLWRDVMDQPLLFWWWSSCDGILQTRLHFRLDKLWPKCGGWAVQGEGGFGESVSGGCAMATVPLPTPNSVPGNSAAKAREQEQRQKERELGHNGIENLRNGFAEAVDRVLDESHRFKGAVQAAFEQFQLARPACELPVSQLLPALQYFVQVWELSYTSIFANLSHAYILL